MAHAEDHPLGADDCIEIETSNHGAVKVCVTSDTPERAVKLFAEVRLLLRDQDIDVTAADQRARYLARHAAADSFLSKVVST